MAPCSARQLSRNGVNQLIFSSEPKKPALNLAQKQEEEKEKAQRFLERIPTLCCQAHERRPYPNSPEQVRGVKKARQLKLWPERDVFKQEQNLSSF